MIYSVSAWKIQSAEVHQFLSLQEKNPKERHLFGFGSSETMALNLNHWLCGVFLAYNYLKSNVWMCKVPDLIKAMIRNIWSNFKPFYVQSIFLNTEI